MTQVLSAEQRRANMDRIYHDWYEVLSKNDAEALVKLHAKDAAIKSSLVPHLLGKEGGICRGHDQMRPFLEMVRAPSLRASNRFSSRPGTS